MINVCLLHTHHDDVLVVLRAQVGVLWTRRTQQGREATAGQNISEMCVWAARELPANANASPRRPRFLEQEVTPGSA